MRRQTLPIRPLPADVAAQIKSSTSIPSLPRAVLGLVKNSLDAGASKIELSVDFGRGSCSIEDDGLGILPAEFECSGGLGKPFRRFETRYKKRLESHQYMQILLSTIPRLGSMESVGHSYRPWLLYLSSRLHPVITRTIPTIP